VEDIEETQDIVLPERKIEDQRARTKSEFQTIKRVAQNSKRRMNRNKMHKWKQRAKAVGIDPLPAGRPTKAQKKEWIELVRAAERELRNKS
jgi:16S rRNA A1518/A1519 N6-dimethyltransferase RsmA/KsgA/DIM1 with predicted DNA glycosylase/AP lyase activity